MERLTFEKVPTVVAEMREIVEKLKADIEAIKEVTVGGSKILTTEEVAKMLRVNMATVRRRFNVGELKGFKQGRKILFYEKDIEKIAS